MVSQLGQEIASKTIDFYEKCWLFLKTLGSSFSKPNGPTPLPFRIRFTLIMKSKNLLSIHCAEKELNAKIDERDESKEIPEIFPKFSHVPFMVRIHS